MITFSLLSSLLEQGRFPVFAGKWSHWGPEDCAKPPPAEAALLTLQVLYMLVQTFWKQQVSIKGKTSGRMTNSTRQAASQEAASLEQAAEATRALIGKTAALAMLLPSIVKTSCFVQSHAMDINPFQHMACRRWKQQRCLQCCSDCLHSVSDVLVENLSPRHRARLESGSSPFTLNHHRPMPGL